MKLCVDCKHYVRTSIYLTGSGHGCTHPELVRPTTGGPMDAGFHRLPGGDCGEGAAMFVARVSETPKKNWLVRLLWRK